MLMQGGPAPCGVGPRPVFGVVRRCPTLPHPLECSTIGAVGLSFRVRNGTGRFPHAMTTVTLFPTPLWGVGGWLGVLVLNNFFFIVHSFAVPSGVVSRGCGGAVVFLFLSSKPGWVCWLGTT